MKILSVDQIREADAYTIKNEPVESIDLMERAATRCYKWIRKRTEPSQPVKVFCGPGNNGGDGLVIARLLAEKEYHVSVYILRFTDKTSDDFAANLDRLKKMKSVEITDITEHDDPPQTNADDLVLDAIFGSGLTRPVKGWLAGIVESINKSECITIAIDTPSGLFSDENTTGKEGTIIEADYTLSFQFPKLAFLFPENDPFVGEWHILPIGLMEEFTEKTEVTNYLLEQDDARQMIKSRNKFDHKGHFGHALLIAGEYGKMGAAVMAAHAALRAGAGLVTAHIPKSGYQIIQTALPECMVSVDNSDLRFSEHPDLAPYNAIGIGPGIGLSRDTQNALKVLIQNAAQPLLFDADAINILGENKTWISFVPKNSIFTPHPKEFERLAGKSSNDFDRQRLQKEFSIKYGVYVVLKGAHTCISAPSGKCFFNSTGNPGMASGGSGDVLTGIILGLLAQKYPPLHACTLGVYLHGLAGDIAAKDQGQQALIAGDQITSIGKAYKKLR
ncbi:MAG: NAD(P)H-hydrate dehydratase [Bacteroidales bacterium]